MSILRLGTSGVDGGEDDHYILSSHARDDECPGMQVIC
jgi:hypothetical protein